MSYLPHTKGDIAAMLETIGVGSVENLFEDVPETHRFPDLDLPAGLSQMEAARMMERIADRNAPASKMPTFLGAGAYNHFVPAVVNHVILRGEFMSSYTPYQPEVSQGTLQAIYEYQSMIAALTGMEVANASHYDGATSLAEAVNMAESITRGRRKKIVLSPAIHPQYRAVVRTYTQGMGLTVTGDETGHTDDRASLIAQIDDDTAMVAVAYPNFFGQIESPADVIAAAQRAGAVACVVTEPVSLGLLKPPGWMGADIVVGEGQGLGISLSYGGPYLGFFATREKHVRKLAGRLVGETVDVNGDPGYVLTLATREQHIRREKATSNICTNQGLMALAASVYLSVMGKHGLRRVAELCYHKAHYAADQIDGLAGFSVDRSQPFFNEFAVTLPRPAAEVIALLADRGIFGG
ncbi:MAG: aminomethyl-transferring glycine dehydrogenase subunit GcvPA [Anaerolineae bacterium]